MTDRLPAETALDRAHAAMAAAPDDAAARLAFHARLAESALFLLLDAEPVGDTLSPRLFELEEGTIVLAFDSEARLAAFARVPVPYAALPGRRLVALLAGQDLGLGLNFDVAPSAQLLPPEVLAWLADHLGAGPEELVASPEALHPPWLPEALVAAIDARLARAAGLARTAWLAGVTHRDGTRGHLLALTGAAPGAEAALALALSEAVRLSGVEDAGPVDVAFVAAGDPLADRLARVGLRFDLPAPPARGAPVAPGTDPARPPRLR